VLRLFLEDVDIWRIFIWKYCNDTVAIHVASLLTHPKDFRAAVYEGKHRIKASCVFTRNSAELSTSYLIPLELNIFR
jgi:hypothetical protein